MAYEIAYFSSFTLPETQMEVVRKRYIAWLVGRWPYERAKEDRIKIGVDRSWYIDLERGKKRFSGNNDYSLEQRQGVDTWLLALSHRDTTEPAVFFQHQVRLLQTADGLLVQHAIRRSAPHEFLGLLTHPARPRIIEDLITENARVRPLNLERSLIRVAAEDVEDTVDHALFERNSVPHVLISCAKETGMPLVDPLQLQRWLRGMAAVAVFTDFEAGWALNKALDRRGLDDALRCFGGAIRTYDHRRGLVRLPYLMPAQLLELPPEDRTTYAGGDLARRLATNALPQGFFSLIEQEDAQERVRSIDNLRQEMLGERATSEQLRDANVKMYSAWSDAAEAQERLEKDYSELQAESERLREDAEEKIGKLNADVQRLRFELQSAREADKASAVADELRVCVASLVLDRRTSPLEYLTIVEHLFADRLVVLPEAKVSASAIDDFRKPDKVGELLWKLATSYFEALVAGNGEAHKCFGHEAYASKEKGNLTQKGKKLRTFEWQGTAHYMEAHLRHGVAFSDAETLRIHFAWLPEEKKILIGHCGGHLAFS